ncbi:SDR family oxidoreductase [Halobacterium yunchengense]|uniref:SDR family oxidoreductase n=1 Tax=Halobacterium yunchengense TaxID=3108497 RepID=UPI0030090FD3
MPHTLVTGATGTLGTALRSRLTAAGHTVTATSRNPPTSSQEGTDVRWRKLDLRDDSPLASTLEPVDVVVHAATAPRGDTEAVDVHGTRRLLDAATAADVDHFVYPSIVGCDDIPYTYYRHKRTAETAVTESATPATVVRSTQFHSFLADLLDAISRLPVWPLPTSVELQPVDVTDAAARIVDHATEPASGRLDPIGGPRVHTVRDLAAAYRDARGLRRPIVRLPLPGETLGAFAAGHATCPRHAAGTTTWQDWLTTHYQSDDANPRAHHE